MISPVTNAKDTASIKDQIRSALVSHPEVKLVLLFGSASAGRLRPDSDVDVALAATGRLTTEQIMSMREQVLKVTGRDVDLVDLQAVSGVILHQILTTGLLVRVDDHVLYGELISRMLFNQADMMPHVRRILDERRKRFLQ